MSSQRAWQSLAVATFESHASHCTSNLNSSQFIMSDGSLLQSYDIKTNTWTILEYKLLNYKMTCNPHTQQIIMISRFFDRNLKMKVMNMTDGNKKKHESKLAILYLEQ